MTTLKSILLSSLLLLSAPLAFGHGDESAPAALHGGQSVKAGGYNLELLVQGSRLSLYVNDDHNQPLDASSAEAEAVVLANKKKSKLTFKHQSANQLSGEGDFSADPQMKVIVSLQLPGGDKVSARFSPAP